MQLDIKHVSGNDLSVDFTCTCPHTKIEGLNHRIYLYGYSDNYFFNEVNTEPREFRCKCGKKYTQQWFSKGYVEIKEIQQEM